MKIILYLTLLLPAFSVSAQDYNDIIKSSFGFGFAPKNLKVHLFEIEYQRNLFLGIHISAGYISSTGGVSLRKLIAQEDYLRLVDSPGLSQYQSQGGDPQGSYYNMSGFKLGLQKNVNLTRSVSLGISISGLTTNISETTLDNFTVDENNILDVEKIRTKYSTYSKTGTEIGLYLQYYFSTYIQTGINIKYISIGEFVAPQFSIGVHF